LENPDDFMEDFYIKQAEKFGVRDINHAKKLSNLK
jgi:hypothetical protein